MGLNLEGHVQNAMLVARNIEVIKKRKKKNLCCKHTKQYPMALSTQDNVKAKFYNIASTFTQIPVMQVTNRNINKR